MKPPRVRFTVRRMMLAVAIVGGGLAAVALWHSAELRGIIARDHRGSAAAYRTIAGDASAREEPRWRARAEFHRAMWAKYDRAARYPWLPVAPDPPEPE